MTRKYDIIVLLTCSESRECVIDNIKNYKRFLPNSMILINDSVNLFKKSLPEYDDDPDVMIIPNSIIRRGVNMIPVHIAFYDFLKETEYRSEYILPLSSNQLFIRDGFYDFMKDYKGGYCDNVLHRGHIDHEASKSELLTKCVEKLGIENCKFISNHDSMFFLYDDFMEMIELFYDYKYTKHDPDFHVHEEYLYGNFLTKKYPLEVLVPFKKYSSWYRHNPMKREPEEIDYCLENNFFIMKRVLRQYDDPCRAAIRKLGGY